MVEMYLSVFLLLICFGQTGSVTANEKPKGEASRRYLFLEENDKDCVLEAQIVKFNKEEFKFQAVPVLAESSHNQNGCQPHDKRRHSSRDEILAISRHNCSLVTKVFNAQRAGYKALIIVGITMTKADILELESNLANVYHINVYLVESNKSSAALTKRTANTVEIFPDKRNFDEFMEDKALEEYMELLVRVMPLVHNHEVLVAYLMYDKNGKVREDKAKAYKKYVELSKTATSSTYNHVVLLAYLMYDKNGKVRVTYPYLVKALEREEQRYSRHSTTTSSWSRWSILWRKVPPDVYILVVSFLYGFDWYLKLRRRFSANITHAPSRVPVQRQQLRTTTPPNVGGVQHLLAHVGPPESHGNIFPIRHELDLEQSRRRIRDEIETANAIAYFESRYAGNLASIEAIRITRSFPVIAVTDEQIDAELACPICLSEFKLNEFVRKLACDHCYHTDCIKKWFQVKHTCPLCQRDYSAAGVPEALIPE